MFQVAKPSHYTGFAPRDGYPRYPSLWQGCGGAWNPGLGNTGSIIRDWSGLGNHGTLTNATLSSAWVASEHGSVVDLDGTNDYIDCGIPACTEAFREFSFSLWFKPTASKTNNGLISRYINADGADYAWYCKLTTASAVFATFQTGSGPVPLTGTTAITDTSKWYHIALIYGANRTCHLLVNGKSEASIAAYNVPISATTVGEHRLWLGAYYSNAFPVQGRMTDVRIYNRMLSFDEIKLLASRPNIAYEMHRNRLSEVIYAVASGNRRRRFILGTTQ